MLHTTAWTSLGNTVLYKRSQTQKSMYYIVLFISLLARAKLICSDRKQEKRQNSCLGLGVKGYEKVFGDERNVSYHDCDGGLYCCIH